MSLLTIAISFFCFAIICVAISVTVFRVGCARHEDNEQEHPELNATRATISEVRQQQRRYAIPILPSSDIETVPARFGRLAEPSPSSSKTEQLLCKFKFHTVTAYQSDFSAASIRTPDDMDNNTSTADNDGDGDDGSVIHAQQQNSKWSFMNMLSTWRKPSKDNSCCICLEAYHPGETICAAITPACDHVFHQECIFQWLQSDHDECPLCRVDLMST